MKLISFFSFFSVLCFSLLGYSSFLFAQGEIPVPTDGDFFQMILTFITSFKSSSPYVIAFLLTKILIAALDVPFLGKFFSSVSSKMKLAISSGLAYLSALLSLIVSGMPIGEALINSAVMPLLVAFIHLVYTIYIEKKSKSELLAKAAAIEVKANKIY